MHRLVDAILHARLRFAVLACVAALTWGAGGCANLDIARPKLKDIAPEREDRQKHFLKDFESRRDESQYRAALSAWERGDTRACEDLLVELLRRQPTHRNARLALADLYLEGQSLNSAESHYRQLIDHHPDDAHAQYCLGMFLEFSGRTEEAQSYFARASDLQPENPLFAKSVDGTELARGELDQGAGATTGTSATTGASAIMAGCGSRRTEGSAAQQGLCLPSRTANAELADTPFDADGAAKTAANLLRSGQPEAALRLATRAASAQPDSVVLKRLLATSQLQSGQHESAQVTLQQALSLDKGDALTYFLLGCTLSERGDLVAAERNFATAHKIDPRFPARP